jgi:hypothetical protein
VGPPLLVAPAPPPFSLTLAVMLLLFKIEVESIALISQDARRPRVLVGKLRAPSLAPRSYDRCLFMELVLGLGGPVLDLLLGGLLLVLPLLLSPDDGVTFTLMPLIVPLSLSLSFFINSLLLLAFSVGIATDRPRSCCEVAAEIACAWNFKISRNGTSECLRTSEGFGARSRTSVSESALFPAWSRRLSGDFRIVVSQPRPSSTSLCSMPGWTLRAIMATPRLRQTLQRQEI